MTQEPAHTHLLTVLYHAGMAINPNPEPLTFNELQELQIASIRQVREAQKNLDRLAKSTGRTAATTNAIKRWEGVKSLYSTLTDRVESILTHQIAQDEQRWAENARRPAQRPAHFRSNAKVFDSNGRHIGMGEWIQVIHEVNRIAQDEGIAGPKVYEDGKAPIFGSPQSASKNSNGDYVENYRDATVIFRRQEDPESVSIVSKTDLGARLIRQAAERKGWHC